jgi:hypothetical protein
MMTGTSELDSAGLTRLRDAAAAAPAVVAFDAPFAGNPAWQDARAELAARMQEGGRRT